MNSKENVIGMPQLLMLTHLLLVSHICVINLGHHCFGYWLGAEQAITRTNAGLLSACLLSVYWTAGNKFYGNLNRNFIIFI